VARDPVPPPPEQSRRSPHLRPHERKLPGRRALLRLRHVRPRPATE
jgi:hypothetical protein